MATTDKEKWLIGYYRGIGDALCALPALRCIKNQNPGIHLTVAATRTTAPIFLQAGVADEIVFFDKFKTSALWQAGQTILKLRQQRFSKVFISPHAYGPSLKISGLTLLASLFKSTVYAPAYSSLGIFFKHLIPIPPTGISAREVDFFEKCHVIKQGDPTVFPEITIDEAEAKKVDSICQSAEKGQLLIAIHPGTSHPIKQWPFEYFKELMIRLAERSLVKLFVIVGPAEASLFSENTLGDKLYNKITILNLPVTTAIAFIGRTDLLISLDSAASHMATIRCNNNIAIYGPKSPTLCGPENPNAVILFDPDFPCRTHNCYFNNCRMKTNLCMRDVSVTNVLLACEMIINQIRGMAPTTAPKIFKGIRS